MNPTVLSILLGFTAGAANIAGGALLMRRQWEERYLKYFMALGAGFMLATSITEMVPASVTSGRRQWRPRRLPGAARLPHHSFLRARRLRHFHFGEETHHDEFAGHHKSTTVLLGLVIHAFFDGIAIASGFWFPTGWAGSSSWPSSCTKFPKVLPYRR